MTDSPHITKIEPGSPSPDLIKQAAEIIRSGGLVIFPTRSLYGLAADAMNPAAVKRVFEVKRRAADNPVSVLISERGMLGSLAADIPEAARIIMDRFWPGAITLVFRAGSNVPPELTAGTQTIGIRLPAHPAAAALAKAAGTPVTATSANLTGWPGCRRVEDIEQSVKDGTDFVLDAGELEPGTGSTILDVTFKPPKILRKGPVAESDIRNLLQESY